MSETGKRWVQARVVDATREETFACWSDAESMRVWMCPGEVAGASADLDFRVGGRYRIVMHGERDYVQHGEYLEIEAPHRVVMTWISDFVPAEESHTRVSVTLEEAGEGRTRVVVVHDRLPASDTYDGHEKGWADILEKLAAHLAGG